MAWFLVEFGLGVSRFVRPTIMCPHMTRQTGPWLDGLARDSLSGRGFHPSADEERGILVAISVTFERCDSIERDSARAKRTRPEAGRRRTDTRKSSGEDVQIYSWRLRPKSSTGRTAWLPNVRWTGTSSLSWEAECNRQLPWSAGAWVDGAPETPPGRSWRGFIRPTCPGVSQTTDRCIEPRNPWSGSNSQRRRRRVAAVIENHLVRSQQ
jgi:hypothetical protein